MGNDCSYEKLAWMPGYEPDGCGAPTVEHNYSDKEIKGAYREANKTVKKNPECVFCTIGPQGWLKCWNVCNPEKPAKFKKVNNNVVLHLNSEKLKVKKGVKAEKLKKDYKQGHLYF